MVREKQLRLVYTLMKPALRLAARFGVPVRTLTELLRLAYYEVLAREGLSQAEIADRFGQSTRHLRSLAKRFESDFFAAEKEIGLLRELEDHIATQRPSEDQLRHEFASFPDEAVDEALRTLLAQRRVERGPSGELRVGHPYVVLTSEQFHHRIDALNHHLEGVGRAVVQRMVLDDRTGAMIKTISFMANPAELQAYLQRMEGDLRRALAELEESCAFEGAPSARFTLGMTLASADEPEEK